MNFSELTQALNDALQGQTIVSIQEDPVERGRMVIRLASGQTACLAIDAVENYCGDPSIQGEVCVLNF